MPQVAVYITHRSGRTGALAEVLTITIAVVAKLLRVAYLAQRLMLHVQVNQPAQLVAVVQNMDAALNLYC